MRGEAYSDCEVCTMDVDIGLCGEVAGEMEVQLGGLQKHRPEGLHTPPTPTRTIA